MIQFLFSFLAIFAADRAMASSAALSYECHFDSSTMSGPPECMLWEGKVVLLCQYYTYPINQQICVDPGGHEHDLCERSLEQITPFATDYKTVKECSAQKEELNRRCFAVQGDSVIKGQVPCSVIRSK